MNENFTFTFTKQETELMLNSLAQMPYAQVASMIAKIQQEAQKQMSNETGAVQG